MDQNPSQPNVQYSPISSMLMLIACALSALGWSLGWANLLMFQTPLKLEIITLIKLVSHHFVFKSAADLVIGLILFHQLRGIERTIGSLKFTNVVLLHAIISSFLLSMASILNIQFINGGAHGILFGFSIWLVNNRPGMYTKTLGAFWFSEKVFSTIMLIQLALSDGTPSIVISLCGVASGLLWQADPVGLFSRGLPRYLSEIVLRLLPRMPPPLVATVIRTGERSDDAPLGRDLHALITMGFDEQSSRAALIQGGSIEGALSSLLTRNAM